MTATRNAPAPATPRRIRPVGGTWPVTVLAVALSLALGGVLMMFSNDTVRHDLGSHPARFIPDAWRVIAGGYSALFEGAVFNLHNDGTLSGIIGPLATSLARAEPLILAGLGITLAFRAGLFNIGGEGQLIAGACVAGWVGFDIGLPPVLHLIVAVLGGMVGGALWGLLAGALKAKAGAHEVITTIMLNYVAIFGLQYLLTLAFFQGPNNQQSKTVDLDARLWRLAGSGLPLDAGILLGVAAAAAVWWLLARSTLGFRLRAVGANPAAARTAGMNVGRTTMLAMALSGLFCGLAGATLVLGTANTNQVTQGFSSNIGFDALTVALLGRMKPWGTLWAGVLFGVLRAGGAAMQAQVQIPVDIITVIQALIVIFIAAPKLTRAIFRLRSRGRDALDTATTNLAVAVADDAPRRVPRHVLAGGAEIVLGLAGIWVFALGARSAHTALFQLSYRTDKYSLPTVVVQTRPVTLVLGALVVVAGGLRLTRRLAARWCSVIAVTGLVAAFIIWSVASSPNGLNLVSLLQGALFPAAIPLILGALAGLMGERAGVVNVAIEGQLLLGAFTAALVATVVGNAWVGTLAGVLGGLLVGLLLAVIALRYLVDQVIVGVVLNVLVLGLTTFLYEQLMQPHPAQFNQPGYLPIWRIPGLSNIPIIGDVFFAGTFFLYAAYGLVVLVHLALFRTRWGLRVRAVGEHPRAADTVGIRVLRTRYRTVALAACLAGFGGAMLVLGTGAPTAFQINMSAGRGFIALAAVIFGRWSPKGAVLAALLFGFSDQLQELLQQAQSPIDSNLLLMAPYVVTLFAVAGFIGRSRPPAADGQPYTVG